MTAQLAGLVVPVALALVPASAGAGAGPPPVALTATPARVVLAGSARTTVRVRNSGTKRVAVDVSRAGFALDLRGRPRIVWSGGARSAAGWLTLRPTHFTIGPRSSASLVVTSKLPHGAEPGDHDALALLATRPVASGGWVCACGSVSSWSSGRRGGSCDASSCMRSMSRAAGTRPCWN